MPTLEAIQTPILTYQHPEHENRVDMVGTVHIAEPGYYEAVQLSFFLAGGESLIWHPLIVDFLSLAKELEEIGIVRHLGLSIDSGL